MGTNRMLLETGVEEERLEYDSPDFADDTRSGQCCDVALNAVPVVKDGCAFSKASKSDPS